MKKMLVFVFWIVFMTVASAEPMSQQAPKFSFEMADGVPITNETLLGKPTLLMFWASWCGVCQREMPTMKTLYEQKRGKGFQAVAVGFQDTKANITNYVSDHASTFVFPVVYDQKNKASIAFGVRATPTFYLLDKTGKIILTHVGGGLMNDPAFQSFLTTL